MKDPYGSLYLHDGMCENAIQFLEDSLKRNGDMEMASLYGEYDMEGQLIRSALGHLLVTCDVSRLKLFVEGLSTRGVINGMEEVPGWDARILNEEMLEMVRREYPETAKGSVRPDYYKDGFSVDIKNYNVESASGRSNLARNIEKQYYERIENLPNGTNQSVIIDVRGQNVSDAILNSLYDDIMQRTNNGVEVLFKVD